MLGQEKLRNRLRADGRQARAEIIRVRSASWRSWDWWSSWLLAFLGGARLAGQLREPADVYRLKLRVRPVDEPPFDVKVTYRGALPLVGETIDVLFDPYQWSKLVVEDRWSAMMRRRSSEADARATRTGREPPDEGDPSRTLSD